MKLTRRRLARSLAAGLPVAAAAAAAAAAPQAAPAPQAEAPPRRATVEEDMQSARENIRNNSGQLANFKLPIETEPSFQFKP